MKKIFLTPLIVGFLLLFQFAVGQNVMYRPVKYDTPIDPELPLNTDIRGMAHWEVLSDRNNNPVYDAPDLSREVDRVDFMDAFYVIEANDAVLRIAKKEDTRLNADGSRSLVEGGEPVGWIHADNLLLWSVCLKADHNLDKKAMVLNSFRPDATIEELNQKPTYFGSPTLKYAIGEVGLIEIGHVFKETEDAVLIGSSWGIIHSDAKREMRGWVPKANVTPWNHRVAWEYNWHPDAVAQRAWLLSDRLPPRGAIIWENKADACIQGTLQGATGNFLLVEKPLYEQRKPGFFNRFPVLEFDADSRIARVGVFGTVVDSVGKEIYQEILEKIDVKDFLNIEEKFDRLSSRTRQFYSEGHICFQNDESLLPLFQPVILIENTDLRALRNFIDQLARNETVNQYRSSLINILSKTIEIYFGEMDEQTRNNLNFCELLRSVTGGCDCKTDWENITISMIPNLPSEMILDIRDEFMETNRILTRILNAGDRYNGRIPRANTNFTWWWIPCDVFPTSPKPDDVSIDDLFLR